MRFNFNFFIVIYALQELYIELIETLQVKLWLCFSPSMGDIQEGFAFANSANTVIDNDTLILVVKLHCGLIARVQCPHNSLLGQELNMQDQEC